MNTKKNAASHYADEVNVAAMRWARNRMAVMTAEEFQFWYTGAEIGGRNVGCSCDAVIRQLVSVLRNTLGDSDFSKYVMER